MKLFYAPKTRSTRPRWMLEELGVPYEMVTIDLKKGEHKTPDYLKIHPLGQVPAFQDGDVTFFESGAIVTYLADKYIEKKFAPALNSPERGKYLQWIFYSMINMDRYVSDFFYHAQMLPENERVVGIVDNAVSGVEKHFPVLTDHLKNNEFVMGKNFTAADILMASNIGFAKAMKLVDDQPVLLEYTKRMMDRPAFRKAIA